MQDNWTLKIDPESRDLILDDAGAPETISGDETTAQAVRLTLPWTMSLWAGAWRSP